VLQVPAGKTATTGGIRWVGGSAAGGPADPFSVAGASSPSPSSTPSPSSPSPSCTPSPYSTPSPSNTPSLASTPSGTGTASPSTLGSSPSSTPTLHLRSDGTLSSSAGALPGSTTIPSADGTPPDGTPHNAATWSACGINGSLDPAASTSFSLAVDAGTAVGNGIQVRVSYDPTGSGTWSRVETYAYFATDPVPGWETYASAGRLVSASGSLADFHGGCVRLEVWNAIGHAPSTVLADGPAPDGRLATLTLPLKTS
jgi:hypothetical protein